jgi:hypothetical protein
MGGAIFVSRGDGIKSARAKRATTNEAAHCQPSSAPRAMCFDGLGGVVRTRGKESTRRGVTLTLALVPRDSTQHAALQATMGVHDFTFGDNRGVVRR